MPQENCQKIKLLKLIEMLRQETDEDHPLKTTDICNKLLAMNIKCDRRTLHLDMKLLNEQYWNILLQLCETISVNPSVKLCFFGILGKYYGCANGTSF